MVEEKLARINELAHLAKERDLTPEEMEEREKLRAEYIAEWRKGAIEVLEHTVILTPDGKRHPLRRKK